jgi:hypothetical protein
MKKVTMFTIMLFSLVFAVMTSCNPKVEVSEPTEVEVAPATDTAVVAEPAVVEGVEPSNDVPAVQ